MLVPGALSRAARTKKSESCRYFYALTWGAANLGSGLCFFFLLLFFSDFWGNARTMEGRWRIGWLVLAGRAKEISAGISGKGNPTCLSYIEFQFRPVLSYPVLFCLLCSACLSYSCLPIQRDGRVGFLVSAAQKEVMCTFYVGTDVGEIESQQRIKFAGGFGGIPNLASGCAHSVFLDGWVGGWGSGEVSYCNATHTAASNYTLWIGDGSSTKLDCYADRRY